MALSFLAPEILSNLNGIEHLNKTNADNEKLKEMIGIYQRKIEMVENDPEALKRLQRKTFGTEPADQDTVIPKATLVELKLAEQALASTESSPPPPSKVRYYLERSSKPLHKIGLFLAGASLIMIAFVCFGAIKNPPPNKNNKPKMFLK